MITVRDFHRAWGPATPLRTLPMRVYIKDESSRFGLNAYKILGASWALHNLNLAPSRVGGNAQIKRSAIVTATSGNHGRAVAHAARKLGLICHVYIPRGANPVRVARIQSEGATLKFIDGDYDEAARCAERDANANGWQLVQDLVRPGYERIPGWVIDGYATLFAECEEQTPEPPQTVVLHMGAGNFAEAGWRHYRGKARVIVARPARGNRTLDCLTVEDVSTGLLEGVTEYVEIDDDDATRAVAYLEAHGIFAAPSGAGGVAGMLKLGIPGPVLAVVTEGKLTA
ncbi:MAG: pyridoxal-phosphate dependent enzyme [Bryobacteraceae bacterium]|nr:pyridoxal-phosphate dependent enzyme [Bryobacteraceae bacterium]